MSELETLINAVKEAGEIAIKYFGNAPATTTKSDGSEVSEADLKVNAHLQQRLSTARPDFGWLSEESDHDPARLRARHVWVVDPIDGTRGFLRDQTDWTVVAGILKDGKPIAGVVYAPARDELFTGAITQQAALNEQPIRTTERDQLANARIIAGKGILKSDAWIGPWPEIKLLWSNSMAYRICLVAAAKADATISLSAKSDWDLVGAHAVLDAAGGNLTVNAGETPVYNKKDVIHKKIIAAGGPMHSVLINHAKDQKPR